MLLQKDKRFATHNNTKTAKSAKPFSILSLGYSNLPNKNKSHRIEAPLSNNHTKSSGFFRNQNQIAHGHKKTQQKAQQKELIISRPLMSMDLNLIDDTVIQNSSLFRFQNITNSVLLTSCQKMLSSSGFMGWDKKEEENQMSCQTRVYVDMKKKIKKLSKGKKDRAQMRNSEVPEPKHFHPSLLNIPIYSDTEVIIEGSIFRNKLISQRMDNDVDTDDQQIASGIRRLHRSLAEAVEEQRTQQTQ